MLFRRLLNYLTDPITSDPNVGDVPIFDGSRFVAGPGGAPSWLLHTAGIPDNSQGSSGDYALGQDGVIYKKQAGTWGAYGGGGTQAFEGVDSNVLMSADEKITWQHEFGDNILDFTDPQNPVVPEAGVYAMNLNATPVSLQPGKFDILALQLDATGGSFGPGSGVQPLDKFTGVVNLTCAPVTLPAGAVIRLWLTNDIGSDLHFFFTGQVQRLA